MPLSIVDLSTAFLIGIMASSHCIAMCGGIAMLVNRNQSSLLPLWLYNLGRISSYAIMGFLLGVIGLTLTHYLSNSLAILRLIAAILLILMGLYIARWHLAITHLEKLFLPIWQLIQPFAQRRLQTKSKINQYVSGLLWGWLPCGLVYSNLTWSATQASPLSATLLMLAFGLGTMPSMLLTGYLAVNLKKVITHKIFKQVSGSFIIMYGIYTLYLGILQLN